MELRVLLVTSRVTFVPENYNQFVCSLATNPSIVACMVVDNREKGILAQGLALLLSTAAPRLGVQLLSNFFKDRLDQKKSAYEKAGKKFFHVRDLNSDEAHEIMRREDIDLILHARTRTIFRKKLLETPRLGCINIHHGLLPNQRGLMCDFWAHLEGTPAGFSIHQMTPRLDDGKILKVCEVPKTQSYLGSLHAAAQAEVLAAAEVLAEIAHHQQLGGRENLKTEKTLYRKNPGLRDFFRLRAKGVKI